MIVRHQCLTCAWSWCGRCSSQTGAGSLWFCLPTRYLHVPACLYCTFPVSGDFPCLWRYHPLESDWFLLSWLAVRSGEGRLGSGQGADGPLCGRECLASLPLCSFSCFVSVSSDHTRAPTSLSCESGIDSQGFTAWFETSAKENVNVEAAMTHVVKKILSARVWISIRVMQSRLWKLVVGLMQ
eukprot:m.488026 g.488026  ORF g.488026 m.488026 type:complete len:183 (+) comp57233_c3_seq2:410-958(+)